MFSLKSVNSAEPASLINKSQSSNKGNAYVYILHLLIFTECLRNSDFGLAKLAAYLAYRDNASLLTAQTSFDIMQTDFVNASAVEAGVYPRPLPNMTCACESGAQCPP